RMVVDHNLAPQDPLAIGESDEAAIDAVLGEGPVDLATAQALASR
ncbi:MAG: hypothetical protein JKY20_01980, partial [Alphaproteobacteria bacterium]|nr:hypothetical protein [Alphaproteobacteria bacterium]